MWEFLEPTIYSKLLFKWLYQSAIGFDDLIYLFGNHFVVGFV